MPYVVAEPCVNCKYTDCVEVCPVDCFYEGVNFLVIHPDECIDCGACEPVCPAKAIFPDADLPEKWKHYAEINTKYATQFPNINRAKQPMPNADQFKDQENKGELLDPRPAEQGS
ncbi:MAG: ferredoxin FdxA [Myxococcales bacterium]